MDKIIPQRRYTRHRHKVIEKQRVARPGQQSSNNAKEEGVLRA